MPKFQLSMTYTDANDAITTKNFSGDFPDFATAELGAIDFVSAAQALTNAAIYEYRLTQIFPTATTAPDATSNVFERINATVQLNTSGKKANLKVPAPVPEVFVGNALDATATQWTQYVLNLTQPVGWEISDGEHYSSTIKGARVYVNSGKTNLP